MACGTRDETKYTGERIFSMIGVFKLIRHVDISGVSGTGVVAYGSLFPSGKVTLNWNTDKSSTAVYDSISDLESIHLHGGNTSLCWIWRIDEATLEIDPRENDRSERDGQHKKS